MSLSPRRATRLHPPKKRADISPPHSPYLAGPDHDVARRAWRQYARAHGSTLAGPRGSRRHSASFWLVAAALAVPTVYWLAHDDDAPSTEALAESKAAVTRLKGPSAVGLQAALDAVLPQAGATTPAPEPTPAPADPPSASVSPPPPPPPRAHPRSAPSGTKPANARALGKIPLGRSDGPPVAGVGEQGVHVDSIALGSASAHGRCSGEEARFLAATRAQVHVCFRVVHRRAPQSVLVTWRKDGAIVRRALTKIPARHAFWTRAKLRLRESYAGKWAVQILSSDGVELASKSFEVRAATDQSSSP